MSCHDHCSGNYGSGSLRSVYHIPVTSSDAFCSTSVSYGDALCLPSSCQDRSWLLDNCQETHNEPISCQPANCGPSNSCSSTAYYVPRPCQGSSFLPVSSFSPVSGLPVSCRPLSYVASSGRPLSPLLSSSHLLGSVPIAYRPLNSLPNSCRPVSLLGYGYRPVSGLVCGSQPLSIVSSSLRPLQPLSTSCSSPAHVFSTCRPSCSALWHQ